MILQRPKKIDEAVKNDIKSIAEEYANTISHAIGIFLVLVGGVFLIYKSFYSPVKYATLSTIIFSICALITYTSSTLYHSTYTAELRKRYRIFDHISIYLLIAGSYTPFILMYVRSKNGLIVLGIIWTMVFLGAIFKYFFTEKFKIVSTLAYLVLGWMAFFIKDEMMTLLPEKAFIWIAIGGGFYTFGIIFYLWRSLYHSHLFWHIFVLAGTLSHFIAVYYCL